MLGTQRVQSFVTPAFSKAYRTEMFWAGTSDFSMHTIVCNVRCIVTFELSCMQVDPRTVVVLYLTDCTVIECRKVLAQMRHRCSHLLVHSWYSHESFNCYSHEGFNCRPATAGLQSQQMLIFKNYYIFINIYLFGFGLLCYGFWRFGVGPSFSLF